MEKEFKELLQSSKKVIGDLEKKVDDVSGDLSEDASALWADMKKSFAQIKDELVDDDNKEKAQEKVLEAKEKLNEVKDSITTFTANLKDGGKEDLEKAKHMIDMIIERDYGEEKEKKESWVEGYRKWKRERCPHN